MEILLTGAGGQLGRALIDALAGHDVAVVTRESLDICDLDAARETVHAAAPEVVINCAAWTDVDGAEAHIEDAYRGNALGARNLAIATADEGIPLLHVSTDYVFDGTASRPYHEFDRPCPRSVYGASKLAGEEAVRIHNPHHWIVRTAWLYHDVGHNFPATMRKLAERDEVRVVDDQFGSPTYAPHLARAIAELIETRAWGTFHLAGKGQTSWYELTKKLYELLEIATPVVPVATAEFPRPAERPRYAVLTTLQNPRIELPDWSEGLRSYVRSISSR